jgi:hypothetical protein
MSIPVGKPNESAPHTASGAPVKVPAAPAESCDLCGSESVEWRSCKLICLSCRAIVRSCSDL